jgi:PAS domain S-box-containing protein
MIEPSGLSSNPAERARVDEELLRQSTYLDELFELAPDAVVLTTLHSPRILRINREFTRIFGYTANEAVGNSLRDLVMPDSLEPPLPEDSDLLVGRKVERESIRRRKDGTRFHAHITGKRVHFGGEDAAYLVFRDISARKDADALFAGEKRLLQIIAAGGPLATTLDALCRLAEDVDPSSLTSILLVDGKVEHLNNGASPSLPPKYVAAINGASVGLGIGPCAAAAHLGIQTISLDMPADDRWSEEMRALTLAHGLRVCWSTPIKSPAGRVLGTLAICPSEPSSPTLDQRNRIEQLTHLASIAIQRAHSIDALRRSEERHLLAMEAAAEGHFDADLDTGEMFVSSRLNEIYDFPHHAGIVNRAEYLKNIPLHPDDRPILDEIIRPDWVRPEWQNSSQDFFEYDCRIIPRPGEIRWLHTRGRVIRNATGCGRRCVGVVADITERKRVEEALRESEQRYERAMRASEAGFWDWDVAGDKFYVSPKLLERNDLTPETEFASQADFLAKAPFHPEDSAKWQRAVKDLFAGRGTRLKMKLRSIHGAETRWTLQSGMCERDAAGRVRRWTGSGTNITEQMRAEEALRLSEERYALAMETSEEGHFDWNVRTDEVFASDRARQILVLSSNAQDRTRKDMDAVHIPYYPGERERIEEMTRVVLAGTAQFHEFEYRLLRGRDQEPRCIRSRWKIFRDSRGAAERVIGVVSDITERKRVAEELQSRQEMLEVAQKAARAVAFEWRVDAGTGQNRWSPELEALYGIPAGSHDGTYEAWKKLVHPQDWLNVHNAIKAAQQSGDVDAEYRVLHPGGVIRWLQTKGRMFFDPDGKPSRIVGFMLDVTDRHLAEEELHRVERQLRQAQRLEALGTLAGGIAHDFNNLLGAILGYGEMALRNVRPGSRLRRDIENIMVAGERGHALVERILAFSRSGVGEQVAVQVEKVVRETLGLFAARLPRQIVIERRLRASSVTVMGDPTQVHQVLMNLLTNAVQAMASRGTLHVALDKINLQVPRVATTGSLSARQYVAIKVTDSGSGIPADVLEKIFDPFFTTKEVGVGTGLGLSLVHGIVTGLGGAIDVETAVGEGSSFKVYLPVAGDVAVPSTITERTQRKARRVGQGHLMVIDDDEALVRLAAETLTDLGYSVVGFTSSAKAIDAFHADPERFDAVITDESMPGASGCELIGRMRILRPTMPLLLVSGYVSAAVIERARNAGAIEVLRKPLRLRQLEVALERALLSTSRASTGSTASSKRSTAAAAPRCKVGSSQSQR